MYAYVPFLQLSNTTLPAVPCTFSALYLWNGGGSQAGNNAFIPLASSNVTVRLCYQGTTYCSPASAPATLAAKPPSTLVALISGGNTLVTAASPAVLDGSLSFDPDNPGQEVSNYSWSCRSSQLCPPLLPMGPTVDLSTLAPGNYSFTLSISDGGTSPRTANATTTVSVVGGSDNAVTVSIAPLLSAYLNPFEKLALNASIMPLYPSTSNVTVKWSISSESTSNRTLLGAGNISDPCTLAPQGPLTPASRCTVSTTGVISTILPSNTTSVISTGFTLLPGALLGEIDRESLYTIRVEVLEENDSGNYWNYAELRLPVMGAPPRVGNLTLSGPSSGVALLTPFNLTVAGWSPRSPLDSPLSYAFAYQTGDAPAVFLTAFQPTTASVVSASVYLPQGDNVTLIVVVATARGVTSNATVSNVNVSPPTSLHVLDAVRLALAFFSSGQTQMALHLTSVLAASLAGTSAVNAPAGVAACERGMLLEQVYEFLNSTAGASLLSATFPSANSTSLFSQTARTLAALATTSPSYSPAQAYLTPTATSSALAAGTLMAASAYVAVAPLSAAQDLLSLFSFISANVIALNGLNSSTLFHVWEGVSTLADSVQPSISVTGEQPVLLSSPLLDVQLSLDYASAASSATESRLFGTGIRLPPSGIIPFSEETISLQCDNCSEVRTTFQYAAYEPHNSQGSANTSATSGPSAITRLKLSYIGGAALTMANLPLPVGLRLRPAVLDPTQRLSTGVCAFWDTTSLTYSTDGCLGLPNPLPPGTTARFDTSLYEQLPAGTSDSAKLLSALQLPEIFAQCSHTILDCPVVGSAGVVYLNPDAPLSAPAVRCPAGGGGVSYSSGVSASSSPALLVIYGASCKYWQNTSSCYWNAALQSFVTHGAMGASGACVARPAANTTTATCLSAHLTDFSERTVNAATVGLRELEAAILPLSVAVKLRVLLCIVFVLFGCMVLAGRLVAVLDGRRRERIAASIFSDELGYCAKESAGGSGKVWTWRIDQAEADPAAATPRRTTSAAQLAALLGLPLARLRFAIPMELLDFDTPGDDEASVVTSTALVFALLRTQGLFRGDQLTVQQAAASKHFKMMRATAYTGRSISQRLRKREREVDFDLLVSLFVDMIADRSLAAPSRWRDAARLWRLILLRRRERGLNGGGWDPSDGLASALLAFHVPDDAHGGMAGAPVAWQQPFRPELSFFTKPYLVQAEQDWLRARFGMRGDDATVEPTWPTEPHDAGHPLDFDLEAITESIPAYLRDAVNIAGGDPALAMRIWTTLLCVSLLRRLDVSWIVSGRDRGTFEKTLLDDAEAWLQRTASTTLPMQPRRSEALLAEFNAMSMESAIANARPFCEHLVRRWELSHEVRVACLRAQCAAASIFMLDSAPNSDTASFAHSSHRVLAEATSALWRRMLVFAAWTAPPTDHLGRAHRVVMLFLSALCTLTVVTGFYFYQGTHCCAEVRERLGCSSDHTQPCRGFTGDCADVHAQFADIILPAGNVSLVNSVLWPGGGVRLADTPTCTRGLLFGTESGRWFADSLVVGLVAAAVVAVMRHLLSLLPRIRRETLGGRWLSASWPLRALLEMSQPVVGVNEYNMPVLGSIWRFGSPDEQPGLLARLALRYSFTPLLSLFRALNRAATAAAARFLPLLTLGPIAVDVLSEQLNAEERDSFDSAFYASTRARMAGAISGVLLATAWIVLAWFILAYGLATVGMLGLTTQLPMLYTWLIALFVENVLQACVLASSITYSILLHYCVEPLWLMSHDAWLELYLDSGSILSVFPSWPSAGAYAAKRLELFSAVDT